MLIGAIIGLIGSIIPEVLKIYDKKQDQKHEIEMLRLQIEQAEKMTELRIREAEAQAQIALDKITYEYANPEVKPTGYKIADLLQAIGLFLNTIVRPVITLVAMGLWLYGMAYQYQFTDWQQEAITCIITFWFGNRTFQRAFGRI